MDNNDNGIIPKGLFTNHPSNQENFELLRLRSTPSFANVG